MKHKKLYVIQYGLLFMALLFSASFCSSTKADENCDTTTFDLLQKGSNLSEEEAKDLDKKLQSDPDDLSMRIKLLGYYELKAFESSKAQKERQKHILWIIKNKPDHQIAGLPYCQLIHAIDGEAYEKAKDLWLKQIDILNNNTKVLGNAADFFQLNENELAEVLLKKAQNLEPSNPEWLKRLGRLYSPPKNRKNIKSRKDASLKALYQFEKAYKLIEKDYDRFLLLSELADQSFESGNIKKASQYAKELLMKADCYNTDWNYGNAIHDGNIILGRCALKSGQLEKAREYLIRAGKTPGSPQLNSFGPKMILAYELLEQNERGVIIEYFQLCSKFWEGGGSKLKDWTLIVRNGGIPDFNGNF